MTTKAIEVTHGRCTVVTGAAGETCGERAVMKIVGRFGTHFECAEHFTHVGVEIMARRVR